MSDDVSDDDVRARLEATARAELARLLLRERYGDPRQLERERPRPPRAREAHR